MRVRYALAILTLFATALPVHGAVFSNLVEYGKVTNSGQSFRTLSGNRDMEPDDHVKIASLGDDAMSKLALTGSEGMMTLNVHSCSGPPLGSIAGHAEATGTLYYEENFIVYSDTLAVGTPVTINVSIGAGSSSIASTTNPNNLPTLDLAQVEGHATIRIDSDLLGEATFAGDFYGEQRGGFPDSRSRTGIFAVPLSNQPEQGERHAGSFAATVGGKVGQRFNIAINTSITTGTNAGYFSVSDADAQISIMWGFDVVGGLADIRTPAGTPETFFPPPTSNATADRALDNLPMSPIGETIPEPASLALIAPGLLLLLLQPRRALARSPRDAR